MSVADPLSDTCFDLSVIGGGPTGLFAAFYAGLRQLSVNIIDSMACLGGQLATLYPEKYIYDVAGFPRVLAKDLVTKLSEQALQYHPRVSLGQQVTGLTCDEDHGEYAIHTLHQTHRSRAILIAAGVGAFEPKRLPLPNAKQFEGRGLHYFVQHVEAFRSKRILIVGGGDSAIDWANSLAPVAAQLTLIHRRDQFRAHEEAVAQMLRGPTVVRVFHELKAIDGDGRLSRAVIYDNRTNFEEELAVDAVLVNIGFNNFLGPIKDWGLELEGGTIKVDAMMRTNRPGIFAAGDIASFPGKLKLIATGFAEACIAVNFAKAHLDPQASVFPGHSSNMKR